MRRTRERALETRKKLLESALDVLSEKPFSKVSMNEIAVRIGYSKGAAYWHFKNKGELLFDILEDTIRKSRDSDEVPENFDDLRVFFRNRLAAVKSDARTQKINKLIQRRHEWPESVAERVLAIVCDITRREQEIVAKIIEESQRRREISGDLPAGDVAILVSAIFHGLVFLQFHELYGMDFSKYADFILNALENEMKGGGNSGKILGGAEGSHG
ncbi:MAG: TetR family transcriptional regulator [Synergistaceae bacterium]|jgi:TetR/AcrR family acrAB operon transcriptional repressor|nr:TetR family transcriptional regulator [Synergistaceae bacterium]